MIVDPNEIERFDELVPEAAQAPVVDELPEKYRGKSISDVVKMHSEAEKLISRQATEVHEVRRLADDLIRQQVDKRAVKPSPVVEEPEVDFFDNPQEAVKRTLRDSPEMKELREMKQQAKASQTLTMLTKSHPDALDVARSPDFAEWVKASKVRLSLYAQADSDYDYDAANELLLSYKAQRNIGNSEVATTKATQKQAMTAAAVDAGGSNESASKKIYRRADIMKLMQSDPDRYQAMQPEIMAAYAEKRVR